MQSIKNTLYWKISALFILILTTLSVTYFLFTIQTSHKYFEETTQRLNKGVAEHMLLEVQPFKNGKVNDEALGKIMHSMMAVNPKIEVYLLSPVGEILSFVVLDKEVKLKYVDMNPVKRMIISQEDEGIIYGDNPRLPGQKTIFSAAEVNENGILQGYIYLTLNSEQSLKISETLFSGYMMRIGMKYFAFTMAAAMLISLLLLWVLIKNLNKVLIMIKNFQNGDLDARIEVKGSGELANMSHSINRMADTIVANIEQLKEIDNLRRELIANISHDLRTPVSVIQGYAETLVIKSDMLPKEKHDEYLDIIIKTSENLKNLMADLFELSKLEAKQIKPQKEKFQIFELLQDMSSSFRILAQEKNITLNTNCISETPMVYADLQMIERVIQNLVHNAINYTPENGEINIECFGKDGKAEVKISNSGKGIKPEDLPKIFNRYYKTDDSAINSGTGLGLAIVKNILILHDSDINVESQVGKTTTFTFSLN